jgi:hypothetical protein
MDAVHSREKESPGIEWTLKSSALRDSSAMMNNGGAKRPEAEVKNICLMKISLTHVSTLVGGSSQGNTMRLSVLSNRSKSNVASILAMQCHERPSEKATFMAAIVMKFRRSMDALARAFEVVCPFLFTAEIL